MGKEVKGNGIRLHIGVHKRSLLELQHRVVLEAGQAESKRCLLPQM